jgi:hypothetical protein
VIKISTIYGKHQSKNGFLSLPAKEDVVGKIGVIAATNRLKIYEVVELGARSKFPEYFDTESTTK